MNVIGKSLNLLRNFRVAQEALGANGRYEGNGNLEDLCKVLARGKYLVGGAPGSSPCSTGI